MSSDLSFPNPSSHSTKRVLDLRIGSEDERTTLAKMFEPPGPFTKGVNRKTYCTLLVTRFLFERRLKKRFTTGSSHGVSDGFHLYETYCFSLLVLNADFTGGFLVTGGTVTFSESPE